MTVPSRLLSPLLGMLLLTAPLSVATAQPPVNVADIPVSFASAQPLVGEMVVDDSGLVDDVYFLQNRVCTVRGCRVFIFDRRSGALIHNDGRWSEAYAPTGRGRQVIRVRAFTDAERPKAEPPSDAPLETAPRIRKVVRPDAGKKN